MLIQCLENVRIIILFLNILNLLSSEAKSNKTDADYYDENGKGIHVQDDSILAETVDGVLKQFDKNSDGYVTYLEFRTKKSDYRGEVPTDTKSTDTPVYS